MFKFTLKFMLRGVAALATLGSPLMAQADARPVATPEIGMIAIDGDITLRRMVIHARNPRGIVLFLHGFPETLHVWDGVAAELAGDYEIHAFDWPGYGQSSRPRVDTFAYGPRDFARVLRAYIAKAGIDRTKLTIYATDIGGLPAILAALEEPGIARKIIVGDFAPFDRPELMQERLRALKAPATNEAVRVQLNAARDEILENATRRGLAPEAQFELSSTLKADMVQGWNQGAITTADAFATYYAQFTRDQNLLDANLARLETPLKVVWGEQDIYIGLAMGIEFARRANASLTVLPGTGHYPHLQDPKRTASEIRAAAR